MALVPDRLQIVVVRGLELVALEQGVELAEFRLVEEQSGATLENAVVARQVANEVVVVEIRAAAAAEYGYTLNSSYKLNI